MQKGFVLNQRWCFRWNGMFSKIKLDGGTIMAMIWVEHRTRCTSVRYQILGSKMIKTRLDRWLAWEGSLDVVSLSESIKDHVDVGLLIEDLLTGHMPRHG
jgi:hypothetical protein